jgi:hypothetical protein
MIALQMYSWIRRRHNGYVQKDLPNISRRMVDFVTWSETHSVLPTLFALQVFWIPVQLLNFKFVPVRHQLNVVLLTSIVWTALLSMWYPPVEDQPDADYVHPE